jgi:hypothetical protein
MNKTWLKRVDDYLNEIEGPAWQKIMRLLSKTPLA